MSNAVYLVEFGSDKLEELFSAFQKHLEETDRGPSVRSYVGDVKRFSAWFMHRYKNNNVLGTSPLDLVEYRSYMQTRGGRRGTGFAPSTVNRALVSLRLFFQWLLKNDQIKSNPVENIKSVAVTAKPAPKWLSRKQQARLMHAVRGNTRDEAMIGLMLHAGLRVSELCSIEKGSIEISERKGQVNVTGKGNKYREVPLNATIRNSLRLWFEENQTDVLFPNRYGRPISTRGVHKLVAEYAYQAKLEDVTPHTLRHTFCKNAIDMGIPIDQVAAMAGHSSLDITKQYTVPSMADLQKAVEKMAWE
ncbi:MAG: tyrosine-type recombinase/integrase [Firmicutes bacterium]|nr:tyrosine-type recombinase/integrase [Bacillota bacterium]